MKHTQFFSLLFAALTSIPTFGQLNLNCNNSTSGLIPLTDLGAGFYGDIQGGLYPGGVSSRPYIHEQKGVEISQTILPLDSLINVNYTAGEVLFIGMGGSNASNAFNMFIDTMKEYDWPGTNPCMNVKGLFYGGKDLHDMVDTTSTFYWDELQGRLFNRGDKWEQVQIAWMLEQSELDTNDVDYYIDYVADQYTVLLQRMLDTMPNLKLVYLTGFHYTGYTHPDHQLYNYLVEPKGYWGNLAIKEVIARQINGDPELAFEGPDKKAPYVTWGPYFWADGTNPRGGDYLTWPCEDYRDDDTGGGFHLEESGKYKEAKMLIDYFYADTVAAAWYRDGVAWTACPTGATGDLGPEYEMIEDPVHEAINIHNSMHPGNIIMKMPITVSGNVQCTIYNAEGVKMLDENANTDLTYIYELNVGDYPAGMYHITLKKGDQLITSNFFLQ